MTRRPRTQSLVALTFAALITNACSSSSAAGDGSSAGGSGGSAGISSAMGGATATGGGGGAPGGAGGGSAMGSGSPFNPSSLKIVDKSGTPSTGLVVVALNPQINTTINSVEVFGVVKNGGTSLHCFAKVGLTLVSAGSTLFSGSAQVEAPSAYVLQPSDTQPMPCVAPGMSAPFYAIGDITGSAVDTVEVVFSTSDFPGAIAAADYPILSGTVTATMPNGGYGFTGTAQISKAIHNVALVGYPRDGSGLPLGRLQAFNLTSLPPGPWTFTTTSGVKSPFHDVLISMSYISGP